MNGSKGFMAKQIMQNRFQTWLPQRKRNVYLLAGLLCLAAAGAYVVMKKEKKPAYKVEEIVRGDIEQAVTALGTIQPKEYVDVGTQVSGQLKKVLVEIGQHVEKGQLLAEIDPTVYETRVKAGRSALDNLQAQLLQRQAQLELANQQAARSRSLWTANAISQDALQTAEANAKIAKANLAAVKAQINQTTSTLAGDVANLGYTKIYAPMSGTVVSQTALAGQTLNANQIAPIVLRVARLDVMTVQAQVAEADVVKVRNGMPVYFTTLGMPEKRWQSTVRQMLPTPTVLNDVVLYTALIDIKNPKQSLMTSMTAQVFFMIGSARNAVLAPTAALMPDRKKRGAFYKASVMTDDGPEERSVTVGLQNRTQVEIKSGLQPGEKVIVGLDDGKSKNGRGAQGGGRYSRPTI